jgi:alpha-glucosidase (family GH31 glycosyl hydrolase)
MRGTFSGVGSGYRAAAVLIVAAGVALAAFLLVRPEAGSVSGSLVEVSRNVEPGAYRVGDFVLALEDGRGGSFVSVAHASEPGRALWSSVPGESFVSAARGEETVEERSGHFSVEDEVEDPRPDQTIDALRRRGGALVFSGRLLGGSGSVGYALAFSAVDGDRLRFEAEVDDPSYDRVYLTYASEPDERFFGFGTQYTHLDLKGHEVPIFIQEQGIGRGEQPITWVADWRAGAGGDPYTSGASVPHYLTSEMRSLFLENYEYSSFDMGEEDRVRVEVFSSRVRGQILHGETPAELVGEYTEYAGRMRPLPAWILSGAVVGLQGGTGRVEGIYEDLESLDTPVAALWLQDWVGQRETGFGTQLWWNWELDEDHYPRWDGLRERLEEDDVRLMTYIGPWFAADTPTTEGRRNLFREASRKGYLVKDRNGGPYTVRTTDFSAAFVDLSDREARDWMKEVIEEEVLGSGASGWMADFGEGLPYDAVLSSGADPRAFHNRYAEEWAEVNLEAIREAGREDDVVFFNRSGYTRSPRYSTLFWLGDQLVSWDEHDGIKSAVTGLLSSGFSGYSLQHSDIGGYTAIDHPLIEYHRSRELLMRWTELAAFTTVFRTHEGNRPDVNHQIYSDGETLEHFSRFARVYAAWKAYRMDLVEEASESGLPVVRHPLVHYPEDPAVYGLRYQFMVGREFMVAPVLDPGEKTVEVYLPAGRWVHLWSGRRYGTREGGTRPTVDAPIGEPAVFFRDGSDAGEAFRRELKEGQLL